MYNHMQTKFGKIRSEVQDCFNGVNERFDNLKNKLDIIESNNENRHIAFVEELNKPRILQS